MNISSLVAASSIGNVIASKLRQWYEQQDDDTQPGVCRHQSTLLIEAVNHVRDFVNTVTNNGALLSPELRDDVQTTLQKAFNMSRAYEKEAWIMRSLMCEESREDFVNLYSELLDQVELVTRCCVVSPVTRNLCLEKLQSLNFVEAAARDRKQLVKYALGVEDKTPDARDAEQYANRGLIMLKFDQLLGARIQCQRPSRQRKLWGGLQSFMVWSRSCCENLRQRREKLLA